MKKIIILVLPILIFSCEFKITKKKDLHEEVSFNESGLKADDVYVKLNGEKEKRNQIIFGEKLEIIFNAVTGFKREEGVAYPAILMKIMSEDDKDTLFFNENIVADFEDGIKENKVLLNAYFLNVLPVNNYKLYLKGYDLYGDGEFDFSMPFEVIENKRISKMEYGLNANLVYLYDETSGEAVVDNIIEVNNRTSLIINGIEGFVAEDSLVFPKFSIKLTDDRGNVVINNPNLLEEYEFTGINQLSAEQQLATFLNFKRGNVNNPYKLEAKVIDLKSGKRVDVLTFLNIQN